MYDKDSVYTPILTDMSVLQIKESLNVTKNSIILNAFDIRQIRSNYQIIDQSNNWNVLLLKEA